MSNLHFDMVYILSKQQQIYDSTLQNGILAQSKKTLILFLILQNDLFFHEKYFLLIVI